MQLHLPVHAPLLSAFSSMPDPRKSRNQIYPLTDILAVAILGILCGGNDWVNIARWAVWHVEWFQSVGLCLKGVPSHDTLSRFFRILDPKAFETCFIKWTQTVIDVMEGVLAIDGKTICNSGDAFLGTKPLHLVSAFATDKDLVLGQVATDVKSNEITAIPELLSMLNVKGTIITIDAIGCQKNIAKIIREKEGNYILGLKGNQGRLYAETIDFFEQARMAEPIESGCSYDKSIEKDHGRVEQREVWACSELDWLEEKEEWKDLKTLLCIKSTVTKQGKEAVELRYCISNLPADATVLGKAVRLHWGVENKLHWHLDVTFNEDKSKVRSKNGPENFSLLKRMVLNIIKADKSEKGGVEAKRKMAGWNPAYRLRLLGVK